jgi:hypothetical protein
VDRSTTITGSVANFVIRFCVMADMPLRKKAGGQIGDKF